MMTVEELKKLIADGESDSLESIPDLATACNVSRATVDRTVKALKDANHPSYRWYARSLGSLRLTIGVN